MQVRRARSERLVLLPSAGGAPVELATAGRVAGSVDSQDELAVSPDGTYLAWTTTDDDRLHLRDADGHERTLARYGRKMRFSPDGKWLAAFTDVGRGDWHQLIVWDLATGRTRSLLAARSLGRFEWARGGIVIAQGDELVYVPLAGDRRSLFKPASGEQLHRFTASAASSRVAVVVETKRGLQVRALDVEQPGPVRELGTVPGTRVENAEQSGDRVVLATTTGVYVVDGDTAPRELSGRRDIHSLWFAADGRLAYASPAGTTVLDGKRAHRLETREPIGMMRFDHTSARVLVAAGRDVRSWDPASDQQTVLASTQEGEQLLGADRYRGGVVLWTGHAGATPSHRILRVLRVKPDGTTAELDRLDGDRAASSVSFIHGSFFATSQDARSVVYRGLDGNRWHLRAGSTERVLPLGTATLSPTGRHVLVSRSDTVANIVMWFLVDTATGAERTLSHAETMRDAAFSADGTRVAIVRADQGHESVAMIEVATGTERTFPGDQLAWTARGLLVWGAKGMTLVSPSGQTERILDEPVEAGLSHVAASGSRALVCFRGGSASPRRIPACCRSISTRRRTRSSSTSRTAGRATSGYRPMVNRSCSPRTPPTASRQMTSRSRARRSWHRHASSARAITRSRSISPSGSRSYRTTGSRSSMARARIGSRPTAASNRYTSPPMARCPS